MLGVALIVHTWNRLWPSPDIWMWVGSAREFAERPLHPLNPLRPGSAADPYLSPYSWVVGRASGLTGASPLSLMRVAALVNLVLLLAGLRALGKRRGNDWTPTVLLAATLLAWGIQPWRWSGFFNLNSIGSVLPLGSAAAAAVGVFLLAAIGGLWSPGRLVGAAVASAFTVLAHPMTMLGVVAVGAGLLVGESRRVRWTVAAAVASGVALALLWPFVSLFDLAGSPAFDDANAPMFAHVAERTFLAWPAMVVAWRRLATNTRDPLAWAFVVPTTVFVAAWAAGRSDVGRVLPWAMLAAHLLLAVWLSERIHTLRPAVIGGALVVAAVGVGGSLSGVARAVPAGLRIGLLADDERLRSVVAPWDDVEQCPPGVIAAERSVALALAALCGDVLWTPVPEAFGADDQDARRSATEALVTAGAAAVESQRQFGVRWVAVPVEEGERVRAALAAAGLPSSQLVPVGAAVLIEVLLGADEGGR